MNRPSNIFLHIGLLVIILSAALGWQTKYPVVLTFLLVLIFSIWFLDRWFGETNARVRALPWPVWLIGGSAILSFLFSTYHHASLLQLLQWFGLGLLLWLSFKTATLKKILSILWALILVSIIINVIGIIDFFSLQDPSLGIASTFGWRNTYGGFLLLLLPLFFFRAISTTSKTWPLILLSILLSTNLFLTFSQGSWFVATLTTCIGITITKKEWNRKYFFNLGKILVGSFFLIALLWKLHPMFNLQVDLPGANIVQASSFEGLSIENRLDYWNSALKIGAASPIAGIGLGNFATIYPQFQQNIWSFASDPHNILLRAWAEGGAPLVLSLFLLMIWTIIFCFRTHQKLKTSMISDAERLTVIGLMLSLAASFLHALMDMDFSLFAILALFAIELGILLGYGKQMGVEMRNPLTQLPTPSFLFSKPVFLILFLVAVTLTSSLLLSESFFASAKQVSNQLDSNETIEAAKKTIMFAPGNAEAYLLLSDATLSNLYGKEPSPEKERTRYDALMFAEKALNLQPKNPQTHVQIATMIQVTYRGDRQEFQRAIDEGGLALTLDPWNLPQLYLSQAINLNRQGKTKEARKLLEQMLQRFNAEDLKKVFTVDPGFIERQLDSAKELLDQLDPDSQSSDPTE